MPHKRAKPDHDKEKKNDTEEQAAAAAPAPIRREKRNGGIHPGTKEKKNNQYTHLLNNKLAPQRRDVRVRRQISGCRDVQTPIEVPFDVFVTNVVEEVKNETSSPAKLKVGDNILIPVFCNEALPESTKSPIPTQGKLSFIKLTEEAPPKNARENDLDFQSVDAERLKVGKVKIERENVKIVRTGFAFVKKVAPGERSDIIPKESTLCLRVKFRNKFALWIQSDFVFHHFPNNQIPKELLNLQPKPKPQKEKGQNAKRKKQKLQGQTNSSSGESPTQPELENVLEKDEENKAPSVISVSPTMDLEHSPQLPFDLNQLEGSVEGVELLGMGFSALSDQTVQNFESNNDSTTHLLPSIQEVLESYNVDDYHSSQQ